MFLESKMRPIVFFPSFLLTATDWSHHRPLPRGDVHVTDLTLLEVPTWLAATSSSKYRKTRCYSRVTCPPSSCCVEIVTWFIRDSQGGLRRACVPPSLCFIHREPQIFLNCTYGHFKSLTFIFTLFVIFMWLNRHNTCMITLHALLNKYEFINLI